MNLIHLFFALWLASGPVYFPPAGEGPVVQQRRSPAEAGFKPGLIEALGNTGDRWALWRNGYLIHVHGDFNYKQDVASNRKTWHALTVGAAIQRNRIAGIDEKLSRWNPELKGNDALATWRHVITQSSGFDYPYANYPDFRPGQMWTYSDLNLIQLNRALARVWGLPDYHKGYDKVLREAYFDAIGMRGWETGILENDDGIRLILDLEDMGRLGLLVLNRGNWNGRQLVPRWFVEQLENKQTQGMKVNYQGPNDGMIEMDPKEFPEAPYGYLTWSNSAGDCLPGASRAWAFASGKGGNLTMWNRENGIVLAIQGARTRHAQGVPQTLERFLLR